MFSTSLMQAKAIKDLQSARRRKSAIILGPDTIIIKLEKELETHKAAATARTKMIEMQASISRKDGALVDTVRSLNEIMEHSIEKKDKIITRLEKRSEILAEHVKILEDARTPLEEEKWGLCDTLAAKTAELEDLQTRSKARENTMAEIKAVYTDFKEKLEALLTSDES